MVAFIRYFFKIRWNQRHRLPLLLFIAPMIAATAWSQNNTPVDLNFNKEMAGYATGSKDTTMLLPTVGTIPSWMNSQLPGQEDTLYVFGISDPGLTNTVARHQAVIRALAFGALANLTSCEHLSDLYSEEKSSGTNSKYEEIYRFSAAVSGEISISTICYDTILSSSEAVVLVGIPRKNLQYDSLKMMRIDAILYNKEADISCGDKMSKKVYVSIRKRNTDEMLVLDASSFYQVNGKATNMRCLFPQSQAAYNRYEFYYTTGDSPHDADSAQVRGTTCKQGLWIAYVSQIMEQLSMQTKILSNDSQRLRDKTEDTSTELLRERSRTRLSWRIREIDIHDDQMWVKMITSKY